MEEEQTRPLSSGSKSNLPSRLAGSSFDTSEKELIISVATLFSLTQLMRPMSEKMNLVGQQEPDGIVMVLFITYCQIAVASIILAFATHVVARGFWIGLLGLRSVAPEKTDWEKQPNGPLVKKFAREKFPDIDRMIVTCDKLGSMVFSFGTAIAVLMVYFAVLVAALGGLAWLLDNWIPFQLTFFVLAGVFFATNFLLGIIDQYYKKFPERINMEGPLARWWDRGYTVVALLSGQTIYGSIIATYFSHFPRRRIMATLGIFMCASMALLFINARQVVTSHKLVAHDLFSVKGPQGLPSYYYENMRPEDLFRKRSIPFLNKDIVEEPYLKLFLPMTARNYEELDDHCPEMVTLEDTEDKERARASALIIKCANSYFKITLNEEPITPELHFHQHSRTKVPGFLVYIPVRDLKNGKHVLHIERGFEDDMINFHIPFWK